MFIFSDVRTLLNADYGYGMGYHGRGSGWYITCEICTRTPYNHLFAVYEGGGNEIYILMCGIPCSRWIMDRHTGDWNDRWTSNTDLEPIVSDYYNSTIWT